MKNLIKTMLAAIALLNGAGAYAGVISDTGTGAYWGGDSHGYGDVIGDSTYYIHGATITRAGDVLTIGITTNFAGHAGIDAALTSGGIGYGDVFLAPAWTPYGSDANHISDNASNGTRWSYGFSLDNRYSNTGGSFKLYQLNGPTNSADIRMSESFMSCGLGSACYYRDGQATAVDTGSGSAVDTGVVGTWTVTPDEALEFKIAVSSTDLLNYSSIAMHWGETCQNDVIEGQVNMVPAPGPLSLMALGLVALGATRRRVRRS
ncbi:hypothetical protein AB595_20375 [Massilia sp. WF1]|uniref:hypothetical protein n=1 Tax=unclassified Massilia TaxID=2609279 RepID=UPI00064A0E37|nr:MULTISPECIES: hypothetical protein [unclassified Massilia]ALK99129.1 hypothetical protein AM586_25990 [Massilia sp. WG5]KLU35153.1 hypothetical protein AB595_20375 [Massilia sp. WF1]